MRKKQSTKQKLGTGFALIEALVAITVLLIAIAAPLSIVGSSLNTTFLARDQMIATHLAGEAFEIVRQVRDTNIMNGLAWNTGFGQSECGGGSECVVSAYDPTTGVVTGVPDVRKCNAACTTDVWRNDNTGLYGAYISGSWGKTPTQFTRKIETEQIDSHQKIIVTVSWQTGSQSRSIVFEKLLTERPTL